MSKGRRQLCFEEAVQSTCELCKQSHDKSNMALVRTWKSAEALDFVAQKGIKEDGLVCLPCRADIRRVLRDPSHKPRWEKKVTTQGCCIQNCNEEVFVSSHMADSESMQSVLSECGFDGNSVPIPTPLCKHHYHEIYKLLQPQQRNCPTCEMSLKHVNCRSCPNPEIIQAHLRSTAGFEGSISAGDKVCFTCYKSHLTILQQGNVVSTDSDLQSLLQNTSLRISAIPVPVTLEQINDLAFDKILLDVGEEFLRGGALLLPDVYEKFITYRNELLQNTQFKKERTITRMWILSNLTNTLKQHINYSCKVRKYGTLLYRPNVDFKGLLQQALWKLKSKQSQCSHVPIETVADPDNEKKHLKQLNSLVLEQCRSFRSNYSTFSDGYDKLDIKALIAQVNPQLWESICLLTKSISDNRKGSEELVAASSEHIKLVRRLYFV